MTVANRSVQKMDNRRTEMICVRLPSRLLAKVDAIAEMEQTNRSEAVRLILRKLRLPRQAAYAAA
ncbi:MAG: ribbon-helix-helix protein, CopG family [Chloroflexi bacterium]|nr:ribbon-helix-helix protein, CopG family [Chloroflexota bacterium]